MRAARIWAARDHQNRAADAAPLAYSSATTSPPPLVIIAAACLGTSL